MSRLLRLRAPFEENIAESLAAGDNVLFTGEIYTARDAAHKIMYEMLVAGEKLPFDPSGQIIYYTGPCPPKPGMAVGSAGPTTSGRMDKYTPMLLDAGLKGMIGKGERNSAVKEAMIRNRAVYFAATGGAGALLASCITKAEVIAFGSLGTESVKKLWVTDFPCIVAIDSKGNDIYEAVRNSIGRRFENG